MPSTCDLPRTASGKNVHLTMTFNPSHLEFVNPVVEGRTRAKQERIGLELGTGPSPHPNAALSPARLTA